MAYLIEDEAAWLMAINQRPLQMLWLVIYSRVTLYVECFQSHDQHLCKKESVNIKN